MKRVAMKARSQCSTSEKKRMESRLRTSSKQIVRALHANGRRCRFYRVTCRRRNMLLFSISVNWTSKKYVSVKGQIVVKKGQSRFFKYVKYQDIESEVEDRKEKWQSKTIAAIVSSRETGHRRRDEGKTVSSQLHKTTQGNQGSDRCTSEGGRRQKLKQDDGDFPACMRRENNNRENKTRRNEDLKGEGGGRLKHCNVDGTCHCVCEASMKKTKTTSAASKKSFKERMVSGSSVSNSMKNDNLIYEKFWVIGANDSVENYADLFTVVLRNDDIQEFDSEWDENFWTVTKIPSDDILESLYKLIIRESEKLKTVMELYNMEIHQKKVGLHSYRLKTMVKISSRIYDSRISRPDMEILKQAPWSRISGCNSVNK